MVKAIKMGYNVHLQRRGQELYRQKEYKAALEYFTQVSVHCFLT